jgi:hypothetical protein
MTFVDLNHTGIVVSNLDEAAQEFHDLLGVDWARPKEEALPIWTPAGSGLARLRYTYSRPRHGETMIELIEAGPETPWWPGDGVTARLHHVAFFADPFPERVDRLVQGGAPIAATIMDRSGEPKMFTYQQLGHGPLVELIDRSVLDSVVEWVGELTGADD